MIVATGKQLRIGRAWNNHKGFLELLSERFDAQRWALPVDLRARGLVSVKYEHDGTVL